MKSRPRRIQDTERAAGVSRQVEERAAEAEDDSRESVRSGSRVSHVSVGPIDSEWAAVQSSRGAFPEPGRAPRGGGRRPSVSVEAVGEGRCRWGSRMRRWAGEISERDAEQRCFAVQAPWKCQNSKNGRIHLMTKPKPKKTGDKPSRQANGKSTWGPPTTKGKSIHMNT